MHFSHLQQFSIVPDVFPISTPRTQTRSFEYVSDHFESVNVLLILSTCGASWITSRVSVPNRWSSSRCDPSGGEWENLYEEAMKKLRVRNKKIDDDLLMKLRWEELDTMLKGGDGQQDSKSCREFYSESHWR